MEQRKDNLLEKRIDELEKEIKLLRTEFHYLKYLWDIKEIEDRGKETKQTIYVNTNEKDNIMHEIEEKRVEALEKRVEIQEEKLQQLIDNIRIFMVKEEDEEKDQT